MTGFTPGLRVNRAPFWALDAGLLVYRTLGASSDALVWYNREGKRLGEVGPKKAFINLRLSPDGGRVAVSILGEQGSDIWSYDFGREVMTRLTFEPGRDDLPVWPPDGAPIASPLPGAVFSRSTGRTPPAQDPRSSSRRGRIPRPSRIGAGMGGTGMDLWALPLEGDRKPVSALQTQFDELDATFSRDGKWVTYTSNDSGQDEVYVQAFPSASGKWQVSNQGGRRPKWSRDGSELFYLSRRALMASRELFRMSAVPANVPYPYDVTADGQRFLLIQPTAQSSWPAPLTVVTNWQELLKE